MKSAEWIFLEYEERRKRLDNLHSRMCEVRDVCQGDVTIPLPELDESERPAVPNLLAVALEQKSLRVASTMPTVTTPVSRVGSRDAEERARTRAAVINEWWDADRINLKNRRRARHVIGYGTLATFIRPDYEYNRPSWQVRDPVTTFPPSLDGGELVPDDCIFTYLCPEGKFRRNYPEAWSKLTRNEQGKQSGDRHFRILEYVDHDEYVVLACKDTHQDSYAQGWNASGQGGQLPVELGRTPNRTGRPLAVIGGRVGLDRVQSDMFQLVGLYQMMAKLFALEVIGMQRAVWPETWATYQDSSGKIVTMADPLRGEVGRIEGGQISWHSPTPSPMGVGLVDRIERNLRAQGGIPAEFGGESSTNVRTGRRGDSIISAAIDFPIQDAQELIEACMEEENRAAIAIDKAYFGTRKSIYFTRSQGKITYTPAELWETDANRVAYSHSGVDLQGLVIEAGQRVGLGSLSKQSFMEIDPLVKDVESEKDRIETESLRDAFMAVIQTRAQADPMFAPALARIIDLVRSDRMELAEAYLRVDEEFKQEQLAAQQGQMPPEAGMPGLAAPETIAAVQPQPQSLGNLAQLMQSLRQTAA